MFIHTAYNCAEDTSESQVTNVHHTMRHTMANEMMPVVACVMASVLSRVKSMTLVANESILRKGVVRYKTNER